MSQNSVALLDLEDRLQSDTTGTLRRQSIDELEHYGRTLQQQLDAGLAPSEFRAVSQWHQSVATTVEVLDRTWLKLHPTL